MTDSLSLVVCTLDRPGPLGVLLEALGHAEEPPDEVVVVDASDDDRSSAVVADVVAAGSLPSVRHVAAEPAQRGLTRQRNLGIDLAAGSIVAFLDDDTVPDPGYLAALRACFERHPDAVGVGGAIVELDWRPAGPGRPRRGWYRTEGWERPEGARWRLRRRLGLDGGLPPGWMPPGGHGRPVAFLPPDGRDHEVELFMGGASAWRRSVFDSHRFDPGFDGYGLYEDLDLCLTARAAGPLFVATAARLEHHHAPEARPDHDRYGHMVVHNGWYVWRRRWPRPSRCDRLRWWATTAVLAACRAVGGADGRREAWGRLQAMVTTLPCEWSPRVVRRRYAGHDHVEQVATAVRRRG